MFDILALVEQWDPRGVLCLASILWLIIIAALYKPNPWFGPCSCAGIFIFSIFMTIGSDDLPLHNGRDLYIANQSQTKWILISDLIDDNGVDHYGFHSGEGHKERQYVLAPDELDEDGNMKSTGESPRLYHFYDRGPEKFKTMYLSSASGLQPNADYWLYKNDAGQLVKMNTGEVPTDDDYYIRNIPYDPINVASADGGGGCPQWLYHPGSMILFGLAGLPSMLVGGYIVAKLKD